MSPQEKNQKGKIFEEENHKDYWENWIKGKESCDEYITLLELFPKDEKSKDSSVYRIRKVIGRLKDEAQNKDKKNILGDLVRESTKEKEPNKDQKSILKNLTMNLVDKVESESNLIMVINDRNSEFRKLNHSDSVLLEKIKEAKIIILILSDSFGEGELWKTIKEEASDKTIAIVTGIDLRRKGINTRPTCTFEQTADCFYASIDRPCLQELRELQHLFILFDNSTVLHFNKTISREDSPYTFYLAPWIGGNIPAYRIASQPMKFGRVVGYRILLAAAIVKEIVNDPDGIEQLTKKIKKKFVDVLEKGVYLGIQESKQYLLRGFDPNIFDKRKPQLDGNNSYKSMIGAFFSKQSEEKEKICVSSMPVRFDGGKNLRSRIKIIYDEIKRCNRGLNVFEEKLFKIVEVGLEKVSEIPLCKDKPEESSNEVGWKKIYIPYVGFGKILTLDRDEIDGYVDIMLLVQKYIIEQAWKAPLCLAVFGHPGSGKSFTVEEILKNIPDFSYEKPLNYNLAQFTSVEELTAAFHQVQDRALREEVPLVIFDEFDAGFNREKLGWLKYFLAPMQDGEFKGKSGTYKVGRAIFIFAGGINKTYHEFTTQHEEGGDTFKAAKGPDFVSRLRGYVNIKGINYDDDEYEPSLQFRRAIILHSLLKKDAAKIFHDDTKWGKIADIDKAVRYAFLNIPEYHHGVRSMEAIIQMAIFDKEMSMGHEKFIAGSLPSKDQLNMHVNAEKFIEMVEEFEENS